MFHSIKCRPWVWLYPSDWPFACYIVSLLEWLTICLFFKLQKILLKRNYCWVSSKTPLLLLPLHVLSHLYNTIVLACRHKPAGCLVGFFEKVKPLLIRKVPHREAWKESNEGLSESKVKIKCFSVHGYTQYCCLSFHQEDHQQHTGQRLHSEKGRRHLCSHRCAGNYGGMDGDVLRGDQGQLQWFKAMKPGPWTHTF